MEAGKFLQLLEGQEKLENNLEIKKILDEHPYCQPARLIQVKTLQEKGSTKFKETLCLTAAYTFSREKLWEWIEVPTQDISRSAPDKSTEPLEDSSMVLSSQNPDLQAGPLPSDQDTGELIPITPRDRFRFSEWLQLSEIAEFEKEEGEEAHKLPLNEDGVEPKEDFSEGLSAETATAEIEEEEEQRPEITPENLNLAHPVSEEKPEAESPEPSNKEKEEEVEENEVESTSQALLEDEIEDSPSDVEDSESNEFEEELEEGADVSEEIEEESIDTQREQKAQKKGFFARLFGKKDKSNLEEIPEPELVKDLEEEPKDEVIEENPPVEIESKEDLILEPEEKDSSATKDYNPMEDSSMQVTSFGGNKATEEEEEEEEGPKSLADRLKSFGNQEASTEEDEGQDSSEDHIEDEEVKKEETQFYAEEDEEEGSSQAAETVPAADQETLEDDAVDEGAMGETEEEEVLDEDEISSESLAESTEEEDSKQSESGGSSEPELESDAEISEEEIQSEEKRGETDSSPKEKVAEAEVDPSESEETKDPKPEETIELEKEGEPVSEHEAEDSMESEEESQVDVKETEAGKREEDEEKEEEAKSSDKKPEVTKVDLEKEDEEEDKPKPPTRPKVRLMPEVRVRKIDLDDPDEGIEYVKPKNRPKLDSGPDEMQKAKEDLEKNIAASARAASYTVETRQKGEDDFEEIKLKPNRDKPKPKKPSVDLAQISSQDNEENATETLAKIYVAQGYYDKAIQAYKILRLKYPEKSNLFADQISQLKKKLKK